MSSRNKPSPEDFDPLGTDLMSAGELPAGTVTFMFTDVEGSTRMWVRDPERAEALIIEHEQFLRRHVAESGGRVVKGMGDGILAVFDSARNALSAAVQIQLALQRNKDQLKARVAIHTGEAEISGNDYYGVTLNCCSRVLGAAHGGQVVLTRASEQVLARPLQDETGLIDLGSVRLRDLDEPIRIFQATHPGLPSEFPPLRGLEAHAHNLPVRLTTFVGRKLELAQSAELLSSTRLITLSGVGGGGKTRLALELARSQLDDFLGGVWFVELANITDADLVPRLIARAVGVPEEPGRTVLESVQVRLRDTATLLVLDNCEQVLAGCAEVGDLLLRAVPELKILATSREKLGIPGETVYLVPPMSVPGEEESKSRDEAVRFDAVRLFAQRAKLANPAFRLTDDNCEEVCRLCRAVDGIPLAVELAAGRTASLTIAQLSARLAERLEILATRSKIGERRHQTMTATLDWSYGTLSPPEQGLIARLAVFRGSFDFNDVEAVCQMGEDDLVELVIALQEKSLVVLDNATGRYQLLEPIRRYAWGKLVETGEAEETSQSHASFFAGLAEEASPELRGENQKRWLRRLEHEHDNVRAALKWSLDSGEGDMALRLSSAAGPFWSLHGHLTEGRNWLGRALEASSNPSPAVLAQALLSSGELAARQGDYGPAHTYLNQALDLAEQSDDDEVAAAALFGLASLQHRRGGLREATLLFEKALARAHRGNDESRAGHTLASLSLLYEDQGRTREGERSAEEALLKGRKTGDVYLVTDALLALGEIRINRGDTREAREVLNEALETAEGAGFRQVVSWATAYLGKADLVDGDIREAERLLLASLASFQELRSPSGTAWAMRHLGRVAMEDGDEPRAGALLREALAIAVAQVQPDAPLVLQGLAELEVRNRDWKSAAILAGAAEAALQSAGVILPRGELRSAGEAKEALRAQLGDQEFNKLAARGSSMRAQEFVSNQASSNL